MTNNLERRVQEHKSGLIPGFTQKYNCHKLVYYEVFNDVNQAIEREKQLKKWSRIKKEALIDKMNKDRKDLYVEGAEISPLASLGRDDKGVIPTKPEGRVEESTNKVSLGRDDSGVIPTKPEGRVEESTNKSLLEMTR